MFEIILELIIILVAVSDALSLIFSSIGQSLIVIDYHRCTFLASLIGKWAHLSLQCTFDHIVAHWEL